MVIDQDFYFISSMEEELEQFSSFSVKKKFFMILGKVWYWLSFVSFSSMFYVFFFNNCKLYKKVVELVQDKGLYFGSLVQDYKVYSLEMMVCQIFSMEMLQEICIMMIQFKSYLLQSIEFKVLVDFVLYFEEEFEVIVEFVLYKCVLKFLKEVINLCLYQIYSKDGLLQQFKENQLVILVIIIIDLGVIISVLEVFMMEKILQKFISMYKVIYLRRRFLFCLRFVNLFMILWFLVIQGSFMGWMIFCLCLCMCWFVVILWRCFLMWSI